MSKTLMLSSLTALLMVACATSPTASTVDVRVTAREQSNSKFAENVRRETVRALGHYAALPPGVSVTATVEEIVGAPYPTAFTPATDPARPVRSTGDPVVEGSQPMVGGSSADTTRAGQHVQSAVVRGTYEITDASGQKLESGRLNANVESAPLEPLTSLTRSTGEFLASRVAAVAPRAR